jgi:hypothetical protein
MEGSGMRLRLTVLVLGAALAAAACGDPKPSQARVDPTPAPAEVPATNSEPSPTDHSAPTTPATISRRDRPVASTTPETVPASDDTTAGGEVPAEVLAAVIADLVGRTEVDAGAIRVITAAEVIWPDGALGCPTPGETYQAAPTAGWQIVLEVAGAEYDYRAAGSGFFKPCAGPLSPPGR